MPASTRITSTPCSRMRSRRNAYSLALRVQRADKDDRCLGHLARCSLCERLDAQVAALGGSGAVRLAPSAVARWAIEAGDHHELPLGDRGRHAEVLLDQQDRKPFLVERLWKVSIRCSMIVGARPPDGSSNISRVGFVSKARPIAEHLLLAARELRAAVPPPLLEAREQLVDASSRSKTGFWWRPPVERIIRRCSSTRERRKQPATLRHVADTEIRDLVWGLCRGSPRPRSGSSRAPSAASRPMIALQSVVLPMPLRPTTATGSRAHLERDVLERLGAPVERVAGPRPRGAVRQASGWCPVPR